MKTTKRAVEIWGELVHPGTGEHAPEGKMWALNLMSREWFLVEIGASYTATAASETYWSS